MGLNNSRILLAAMGVLALSARCHAGVQAVWPVINLSQYKVNLSFDGEDDCVYNTNGDYSEDDLNSYYAYYPYNTDDWPVAFRKFTMVDDLASRRWPASGTWTLQPLNKAYPPDFLAFEMEMKNSGFHCFEATKTLDLSIQVGDKPAETYRLNDEGTTHWQLYKITSEDTDMIDLGAGGHFNWKPLTVIASLFKGKEPTYKSPEVASWGFTTIYDGLNVNDRSACILEKDVIGGTDCLVAGVALIILPNGVITAIPLPDNGHHW